MIANYFGASELRFFEAEAEFELQPDRDLKGPRALLITGAIERDNAHSSHTKVASPFSSADIQQQLEAHDATHAAPRLLYPSAAPYRFAARSTALVLPRVVVTDSKWTEILQTAAT
eukprot:344959_1